MPQLGPRRCEYLDGNGPMAHSLELILVGLQGRGRLYAQFALELAEFCGFVGVV